MRRGPHRLHRPGLFQLPLRIGYKQESPAARPGIPVCIFKKRLSARAHPPRLFAGGELRRSRPNSLFDLARKEKRFFRLAAFALPGPASRRPAKGAAAERENCLGLPPAAAVFAPPIFFSSCRKEDGPRPGQKKRALNALDLCPVTRLVIAIVGHGTHLGAILEWAVASVSARSRFAWRCLGYKTRLGVLRSFPLCTSLRAHRRRARQSVSFSGGRKGRPYGESKGPAIPRGYPRGGPQAPFGRFKQGGP